MTPLSIRRHSGALEQLAKTDKIEAFVIAQYAVIIQPRTTPGKSKTRIAMKDLLARRRQVMQMRTQDPNRIKIMGKQFEVSYKRLLKVFDTEIISLEKKLELHVQRLAERPETRDILKSAPGVGDTLADTLLAEMAELGQINNRQASALLSVPPINCDSGTSRGRLKYRVSR